MECIIGAKEGAELDACIMGLISKIRISKQLKDILEVPAFDPPVLA